MLNTNEIITTVWKNIPIAKLENLEASSDGMIRKKLDNGEYIGINQHSYSNGYKFISYWDKEKQLAVQFSVHRLVCAAFNDIPKTDVLFNTTIKNDHIPFIVNHKDGIKYNNNYENLEWVTPMCNSEHAFTAGLNTASIHIEVINTLTFEKNIYYSLSSMCSKLIIPKDRVIGIIRLHNSYKNPYMNKYIFKILKDDSRNDNTKYNLNTAPDTAIFVYDYLSGKFEICNNSPQVSKFTSVNERTIRERLSNIKFHTTFRKTISGYEFFSMKNIRELGLPKLDTINKAQATVERLHYNSMLSSGNASYMRVMEVKDKNGNVFTYNSMKEAAKETGVDYAKIKSSVNNHKNKPSVIMIGNYLFRWKDENKPWSSIIFINIKS